MSVPNLVSDRSPLVSLLLILLNVFLGYAVVGQVLGLEIASLVYDGNLLNDMTTADNRSDMRVALLIMAVTGTFIGFIVFPLIHIVAIEHKRIPPFFPPQRTPFFVGSKLMMEELETFTREDK